MHSSAGERGATPLFGSASHSKAGYAFMRANYEQVSESSKFLDTSLRAQGGGGDDLMRLVCTQAAAPVIEQEAVGREERGGGHGRARKASGPPDQLTTEGT